MSLSSSFSMMIPAQGRNLFGKGPNKTQTTFGCPGSEMIILLMGHSSEFRSFRFMLFYIILHQDHQFIPPNAGLHARRTRRRVRGLVGVIFETFRLERPTSGRRQQEIECRVA